MTNDTIAGRPYMQRQLLLKPSNLRVLEANMANENVKLGSQSASANTGGTGTSSLVSTHVAGTKVKIDPVALKHLVETLRTKLQS